MSKKGAYIGGHTIIGPRSGWFSFRGRKRRKKVVDPTELAERGSLTTAGTAEAQRALQRHAEEAAKLARRTEHRRIQKQIQNTAKARRMKKKRIAAERLRELKAPDVEASRLSAMHENDVRNRTFAVEQKRRRKLLQRD